MEVRDLEAGQRKDFDFLPQLKWQAMEGCEQRTGMIQLKISVQT